MDRVSKVDCPKCGTPLRSGRGVRVGRQVSCPKCGTLFAVPEGAAGPVNFGRLILAVFGVLLYLGGGAALGYYCFALNAAKPAPPPAGPSHADEAPPDDEPAAPASVADRPTVEVDPADEKAIDDAVVKGVWWLKQNQQTDGSWGEVLPDGANAVLVGYTALPALALLECGVPADDKQIQKAAALVREQVPKVTPPKPYNTYQLALAILFLDRLGDPKDKELIQYLALRLIASQRPDDGAWGYYCPQLDQKAVPDLLKQLGEPKTTLEQWRQAAAKKGAVVLLGDPGWRSDNSNTQFAVLALWVAGRPKYGVPIEKTIALVENHFRTSQLPAEPDPQGMMLNLEGAWPYNQESGTSSNTWPTMTAAGLLSLAIAHGTTTDPVKQKQNALDDPQIKLGLAMLGREIDRSDDKRGPPDLYFLWSLERVGVLFNLPKIEGKDWYAWGRKDLLARQQTDGHWQDGHYWDNNAIHDTCFALLFLKQANLAQDLTSKLHLLEKK